MRQCGEDRPHTRRSPRSRGEAIASEGSVGRRLGMHRFDDTFQNGTIPLSPLSAWPVCRPQPRAMQSPAEKSSRDRSHGGRRRACPVTRTLQNTVGGEEPQTASSAPQRLDGRRGWRDTCAPDNADANPEIRRAYGPSPCVLRSHCERGHAEYGSAETRAGRNRGASARRIIRVSNNTASRTGTERRR